MYMWANALHHMYMIYMRHVMVHINQNQEGQLLLPGYVPKGTTK